MSVFDLYDNPQWEDPNWCTYVIETFDLDDVARAFAMWHEDHKYDDPGLALALTAYLHREVTKKYNEQLADRYFADL